MKLGYVIAFGAGVGAGVASAWLVMRKHYEDLADEEIESVKEFYKKSNPEIEKKKEVVKILNDSKSSIVLGETDSTEHIAYEKIAKRYSHSESEAKAETTDKPYVITPEMFVAENRDWDKITLTWYSRNGLLVTEEDEPIDIRASIGEEALSRIGEYEKGVVYVRNERLEIDYEVILDTGSFYPEGAEV
jgi:hypothetical protein